MILLTAAYLVISMSSPDATTGCPVRMSETGPDVTSDVCRTDELWLRQLPGDKDRYVAVFETTQRQYELVTGRTPSRHPGATRPVESVSWNEVMKGFVANLNRRVVDFSFDLPGDDLWTTACMAGAKGDFHDGSTWTSNHTPALDRIARYGNNRHDGKGGGFLQHVRVASYEPNAWGIYDMHGNVAEWTRDWSSGKHPGNRYKSVRGGCWYPCMEIATAPYCTASWRGTSEYLGTAPDWKSDLVGFRVVATRKGGAK